MTPLERLLKIGDILSVYAGEQEAFSSGLSAAEQPQEVAPLLLLSGDQLKCRDGARAPLANPPSRRAGATEARFRAG